MHPFSPTPRTIPAPNTVSPNLLQTAQEGRRVPLELDVRPVGGRLVGVMRNAVVIIFIGRDQMDQGSSSEGASSSSKDFSQ